VHIETVVLRGKFSGKIATEQQPPNVMCHFKKINNRIMKNYIRVNHLKLIIIIMLVFLAFQQIRILKAAKDCQCWYMLDEIQNDLNAIKDRLNI